MKFVSRYLPVLLLATAVDLATAAPVKPVLPCDRAVYAFGGSQILAKGVRDPGSNDFAARIDAFFMRVCGHNVPFQVIAEEGGRVVTGAAGITSRVVRSPGSIVIIHYPLTDIESGASVDALLQAYRLILDGCARAGSICIIGGQQPANALTQAESERQLELERRASAAFGPSYLPLYRYFQSESSRRRLMLPLDSGDGRMVDDLGHELMFNVYRRRLLELTGAGK